MITIEREWVTKNPVGTVMVPGVHIVPETTWPWLEWIKENISERMFVYFHRMTGNWVLAAWVFAPGEHDVPICKEFHTFRGLVRSEWPEGLPPPKVLRVHKRPFDQVYAEMLRNEREKKWQEAEDRRRLQEEKEDMAKSLRKRGLEKAAAPHSMANWRPRDEFSDTIASILTGKID